MLKSRFSIFFIIGLVFTFTSGQSLTSEELEQQILNVFGPNPDAPTVRPTTAPVTKIDDDGSSCICVPYYLCDPDNDEIVDDGSTGIGVIDIRFDPEGCQVSIEKCCKKPREETNPLPIEPHPERTQGCGIRNDKGVDFQITGATSGESEYGEFPWTIAILSAADSSPLCVGSLIHPKIVLTAAHCISKYRPLEVKIRAGEWDTQTNKERFPYQERTVSGIVSHPSFNAKTLAFDIALVFLTNPVDITETVNTICLPSQDLNMENLKNCYATGWGKTNFGKAGRYSVIMKKVNLDTVPHSTCESQMKKTRLGRRFTLHKTFICAGGKKGVDTCEGDGGAPLACPVGNKGRFHQAGVVAWGIGCGEKDVPGVYGYVSKFRSWIDDNVKKAGYDTSSYTDI